MLMRELTRREHGDRGAAGAHDKFFEQLAEAEDGFTVVAEHYGRGLFSRTDG